MKSRALLVVLALAVVPAAAAADIATIGHGERVDLEQHLVEGKYVLFDFYADWCGPCRQLMPRLEEFAAANPESFALRKIDIVNWQSEVAKQYRLGSIPHLKLYDPDGRLISQGNANPVLRALVEALGDSGLDGGGGGRPRLAPLLVFAAVAAVVLYLFTGGRKKPPAPEPPTLR